MKVLPKHLSRQRIAAFFRRGQHIIPEVMLSLLPAAMSFKRQTCTHSAPKPNKSNQKPHNFAMYISFQAPHKRFWPTEEGSFSFTTSMLFCTFALQSFFYIKWVHWAIALVQGITHLMIWMFDRSFSIILAGIKLQTISVRFNREVQTKVI